MIACRPENPRSRSRGEPVSQETEWKSHIRCPARFTSSTGHYCRLMYVQSRPRCWGPVEFSSRGQPRRSVPRGIGARVRRSARSRRAELSRGVLPTGSRSRARILAFPSEPQKLTVARDFWVRNSGNEARNDCSTDRSAVAKVVQVRLWEFSSRCVDES